MLHQLGPPTLHARNLPKGITDTISPLIPYIENDLGDVSNLGQHEGSNIEYVTMSKLEKFVTNKSNLVDSLGRGYLLEVDPSWGGGGNFYVGIERVVDI